MHFPHVFTAKMALLTLQCNVFFTFSYPSHVKHLLLRAFLEDCLPERLSKVGVLAERGMKKSKKHRAIAPVALDGNSHGTSHGNSHGTSPRNSHGTSHGNSHGTLCKGYALLGACKDALTTWRRPRAYFSTPLLTTVVFCVFCT